MLEIPCSAQFWVTCYVQQGAHDSS